MEVSSLQKIISGYSGDHVNIIVAFLWFLYLMQHPQKNFYFINVRVKQNF